MKDKFIASFDLFRTPLRLERAFTFSEIFCFTESESPAGPYLGAVLLHCPSGQAVRASEATHAQEKLVDEVYLRAATGAAKMTVSGIRDQLRARGVAAEVARFDTGFCACDPARVVQP